VKCCSPMVLIAKRVFASSWIRQHVIPLIESQVSEVDGHIVLINISFNCTKVSLCNIDTPNKLDLQLRFISTLNGFLCSNAMGNEMSLWKLSTKAVKFHGG